METQEKVRSEMSLEECVVATNCHGAACKFFLKGSDLLKTCGVDDQLIVATIETNDIPPLDFRLIIVDEAHDMTKLYCRFIQHLLQVYFQACHAYHGRSLPADLQV